MKKTNATRLLALMSVVLLATMAAVPALHIEEAEAAEVPDLGTKDAIYWWLRVIPVASELLGAYEYLTIDQRVTPPAGDDNAVKAYARDVDALRSAEQMFNIYGISASLVNSDKETWKLTNAYLNRAAEVGAGDLWYSGASLDENVVLDYAGVYDSIGNGNRNTQEILDEAVRVSTDLKSVWNNTSYGEPLNIELVWDGASTGVSSERLTLDFFSIAQSTSNNNIVYLTQTATQDAPDTATSIWSYDTTGTITPIAAGSPSTPLDLGANDISSLPSGFYKLSPGSFGGPFLTGVSTSNAASVKGGAGIIKDDNYGYITVSDGGITDKNYSKVIVNWGGDTFDSSTLDFKISGASSVQTSLNAPFKLVTSYIAYMDQLNSLLDEAARSAQTMWSISSVANSSNILLSPSSIMPSLRDNNIPAEQAYAMYVLALDQIGQYNASYGDVLKGGMTKLSAQSLDLYCQGDLHATDGTIVAENVIFSPYVYTMDWELFSLRENVLNQSGMVFVWDEGTTLVDWAGPSSSDNYGSVLMDKGQYMTINEIVYKGSHTDHVVLETVSVDQIEVFSGIDWERADPPKVMNAATLIMIIIIELGIIIGLIGYSSGQNNLYLIALIVLLLGVFGSDILARLILGVM